MKKREAVRALEMTKDENEKVFELEDYDKGLKCGSREAYENAINIVKQIDEPERPVLSEKEDKWLKLVMRTYPLKTDQLYIITRQGWGYDFEVTVNNQEYKLSYKPYEKTEEKIEHVKERLMNAIIYGYTIKKDQRYLVEIPNNLDGRHNVLVKNFEGTIFLDYYDNNIWRELPSAQLTEEEIKEDFAWAWNAGFAEEVEE